MRKIRKLTFYLLTLGGFSALMFWIVEQGEKLELQHSVTALKIKGSQWDQFVDSFIHNIEHPLAILLAQIITIILSARILGYFCKKIGQPAVIGEIIAGIVLGPSLLGHIYPGFSEALFPAHSLNNLQFISQIGLILFMFTVGMELDLRVLKNQAREAIVISNAGIIIPFALGMVLAYFIYESYAPEGIKFSSFGMFLAIAMSITAFPVLARIVQEKGIHKTKLGAVVITCAAADDITAWLLLAVIIAIVKAGSFVSSLYIILLAFMYIMLMINIVRPFLKRVGDLHSSRENLNKPVVAIFFLTLLLSSYATEIIGIHALFGAFMAGAVMPENPKFRSIFIEKIEDVAIVLLLPLFFVFTGLRTQIGLLDDPRLWMVTALIILVAVAGKFLGGALAARFVGQRWKESLTIGALMNTRGLMELVVLNIGYDLGVLTPEVFAMMVIMALVTTFMTSPSISLINWAFKPKVHKKPTSLVDTDKFRILISFGNPKTGRTLLRFAHTLVKKQPETSAITALHLSPTNEHSQFTIDQYERDSFDLVLKESKLLNQPVTPLFKVSSNIETEINSIANSGKYNLLLVGVGQSIFEGSLLGKIFGLTNRIINPEKIINQVMHRENPFDLSPFDHRTQAIISGSLVPVGILIDKGLTKTSEILVPVFDECDYDAIVLAKRISENAEATVTILGVNDTLLHSTKINSLIAEIKNSMPDRLHLHDQQNLETDFLKKHDLMIISAESWKEAMERKSIWISGTPSTLIIAEKNSRHETD